MLQCHIFQFILCWIILFFCEDIRGIIVMSLRENDLQKPMVSLFFFIFCLNYEGLFFFLCPPEFNQDRSYSWKFWLFIHRHHATFQYFDTFFSGRFLKIICLYNILSPFSSSEIVIKKYWCSNITFNSYYFLYKPFFTIWSLPKHVAHFIKFVFYLCYCSQHYLGFLNYFQCGTLCVNLSL